MDTIKILFDELASGATVLEDYQNQIFSDSVIHDCRKFRVSIKTSG